MNMRHLANEFRERHGMTGKGGVVVFFNGTAEGWMNELRDPHAWVPGCIAIDETGNTWESVGGNDYDGAKEWSAISNN
ncbi:hypothetical protein [Hahella ganghwensis]|uniref:hypothetical protein n=1 Tax=Hahella ganghwensis TaxID=286420 RepID=UPI0003702EAE|nr:hypothetical protein [Hahella ganghwensis]